MALAGVVQFPLSGGRVFMGKAPAMACHSSPPPLFCMKHVEQAIGWIRWRIFVHEFLRLRGSHGVEVSTIS